MVIIHSLAATVLRQTTRTMKVKNQIFFILLCLTSVVTNGQHLFTQEISDQERIADRKRAELKISRYSWTKSDSTYFYTESYNKNGQIISHYDSEFDITRYDYNNFGKRIRAIQMIDNSPDTAWVAFYIGDTLLYKVIRDIDSKYIETLYFDSLERTIKVFKKYRKSERVDSVITTYYDSGSIEMEYKNGKPISRKIETLDSSSSIIKYLKYINDDSTFHYLTWMSTFDKNGNEVSRVQEFYDRDSKTEYYTTYSSEGLEKSSIVKSNGKVDFETLNFYDSNNRLMKSEYKQQDYRTETEYFYDKLGLEIKSITKTFEDEIETKTETYISIYEFYTDK